MFRALGLEFRVYRASSFGFRVLGFLNSFYAKPSGLAMAATPGALLTFRPGQTTSSTEALQALCSSSTTSWIRTADTSGSAAIWFRVYGIVDLQSLQGLGFCRGLMKFLRKAFIMAFQEWEFYGGPFWLFRTASGLTRGLGCSQAFGIQCFRALGFGFRV